MRKTYEANEQMALIQYLALLKRQKRVIDFYANSNEVADKNKIFGDRLKKMGKKAGVADITIFLKNKILFIEMKRKRRVLKNGKKSNENLLSPSQVKFLDTVNKLPYAKGYVAYGFEEAKKIIEAEI